jgi:metalloendopeptidase OMA1, mitochondrial
MRRHALLLALACLAIPASGTAQNPTLAGSSRALSQDSLRQIGELMLQRSIKEFGLETNPEWRRDVGSILTRLRGVSGFEGPKIEWEIVRDSSLNAAAAPGAVMIINVGLPLSCREYTRAPVGNRSSRERYEGCVGAVLGHELAHVTLGHVDSVAAMQYRRQQIGEHMESVSSVADALRDKVITHGLAFERAQELDADRVGSLYLLRGGWQVQDMMDLFRSMDSALRTSSVGVSRDSAMLTWLAGHPRGSEREARLETFRGTLKLAQRDFDDALTLVNNGIMLDSAAVMLDRVLKVFPDLTAARHARAAALHQQWLNGTPVRTRQLQGSVATYSKWFLPGIRGGDATLLNEARRAYQSVLAKEELPYTLSNLAVLDAYAGDFASAQRRAERSVQMQPRDPFVLNNQGVVLFLAGRQADAVRVFETAMRVAVADSVGRFAAPSLIFNFGKTLAVLKDPRAPDVLEAYLQIDTNERSEWRREAIALRGPGGGPVAAPARPPAARPTRSVPPSIAGVKLGDAPATVLKVLGPPDNVKEMKGGVIWHYESRGIAIGVDPEGGVVFLALLTPSAGSIDGVRVGDPVAAARAKWGNPSDVEADALTFDRGGWFLKVIIEEGLIATIGIISAEE